MENYDVILAIMNIAIGIFLVVSGIIKKGPLYNNDLSDKIQDEVKKTTSITLLITGALLAVIGVVDLFPIPGFEWVGIVLWGITVVVVIASIVIYKVKFGKYQEF